MFDSYLMTFADKATYDIWEDANIIVHEPPDPGETVGGYKEWVQSVVEIGQVDTVYFDGIQNEPPTYHAGYFVDIMTSGRKSVCQSEVVDPYPIELPHWWEGGKFFQKPWKKFDP